MNERKNRQQSNNKKDYYFPVIVSQLICCTACVLLFFFIRSGEGGSQLKDGYSSLLEEDFFTAEFSSVVSGVKEYLLEGSSSFAVFGSHVEPYSSGTQKEEQATTQETEPAVTEPSTEKAEAVQTASLTGVPLTESESAEKTVPLKLSYKKEQKMLSPVYEGRYTSYFGERTDPIAEGSDFHKGLDIGADEGDRIRAVFDGKVVSVSQDSRSGLYVILEHEKGVKTFYCHCSKILVEKGDTVKQGDTIALVGSTGYSTGPHLHFEVRINDVSVDPLPLLENAD